MAVLRHSTKKPGCGSDIMSYFQRHTETGISRPDQVAVVGDRALTDVIMANTMGSYAVFVNGILAENEKSMACLMFTIMMDHTANRNIVCKIRASSGEIFRPQRLYSSRSLRQMMECSQHYSPAISMLPTSVQPMSTPMCYCNLILCCYLRFPHHANQLVDLTWIFAIQLLTYRNPIFSYTSILDTSRLVQDSSSFLQHMHCGDLIDQCFANRLAFDVGTHPGCSGHCIRQVFSYHLL